MRPSEGSRPLPGALENRGGHRSRLTSCPAGQGRCRAAAAPALPERPRFEFGARRSAGPVTCKPAPVSGGGGGAGRAGPIGAQGAGSRRAGPIGDVRGAYGCAGGTEPGRSGIVLSCPPCPCPGTAAPPWLGHCRQLPSTMLPAAGSRAVRPGPRHCPDSW